ncbi:MAG: sigma-70 family RNA polymerase sigma factor [Gemmatimonadales bacterium]|nr:sigma-70 family RNA polymerase sigma factor [Gemmatimonadales bacterium]
MGQAGVLAVTRPRQSGALVAAHLAGDGRASTELVGLYRQRLVAFIDRMIGDRDRAEDLVQEAFVRVFRHLHRFDQARKFSTWVYTIASNLAKNELRNRSRSPLVLYQSLRTETDDDQQQPLQFEDVRSRPDDIYRQRHLRDLVDRTVAQLPAHHRSVFVMRELEGRSYEEIASSTGVNLGTVKSRLNRARRAFAEMIQPHLD